MNKSPSSDSGFSSYPSSHWLDAEYVALVTITEVPSHQWLVTGFDGPAIAPDGLGWFWYEVQLSSVAYYTVPFFIAATSTVIPLPKTLNKLATPKLVLQPGVEGAFQVLKADDLDEVEEFKNL